MTEAIITTSEVDRPKLFPPHPLRHRFDSRSFLANKGAKHKEHIGVGLIDPRRDGIVFTSSDHDFRKKRCIGSEHLAQRGQ